MTTPNQPWDLYLYRVVWSSEDEEFVATCAEFPSLSWLAPDPTEALQGIRQLVADCVTDLATSGEPVPTPIAQRHYSGRFQVQIPPSLHQQLALQAAEENISLNRLVALKLASDRPPSTP
ncbi:MAG: type II toxin-antitoxin system HicB family antitoxin [Prochlorothrix sp.]